MIATVALAGVLSNAACAAWPSFGSSKQEPSRATAAKESGSPWAKLNPWKSDAQSTPAMAPYYGAARPETTTQKITRVMNPTKWFTTAEKKPSQPYDPISLSNKAQVPTPELRVAMAQLAESRGNQAEARQIMEQTLAQSPKHAHVLREYARLEDRAGRLAEAEQFYGRAVAADPKDPAARNDLGLCLARAGKLRDSARVLQSAVEMNPKKALYRNNLATVLVELGDTQAALVHLSTVHPPAVAHYNLGQLFTQRGRHAEAAGCFQTALSIDPAMQPAHAALARLHQGTGQLAARPELHPTLAPDANVGVVTVGPSSPIGPAFPVPRSLPPVE